jgi:hypothetical protein
MTEDEARLALERLDPLWEELFPTEQARIIHLLVAWNSTAVDMRDNLL